MPATKVRVFLFIFVHPSYNIYHCRIPLRSYSLAMFTIVKQVVLSTASCKQEMASRDSFTLDQLAVAL